jgi:MoaA/NifB/PqqE/SkfB family radical SAM enzyme
MDAAIVLTYRCNARCRMCNTWAHPSRASEEISLDTLAKLPDGIGRLNITGGEPTLRRDLVEVVDVLAPKARRLEISTNGSFPERLASVARHNRALTIRISIEGMAETNDAIRGIDGGFDKAMASFHALREAGVRDLGFAMTMQDDNAHDVLNVYKLASRLHAELATAVPHNGYYFHKEDNSIRDVPKVQAAIASLIDAFLRSRHPKEWGRAYLNRGLVDYVSGASRRLECTAGTDIFFLDPYGEVYPCNALCESMGNLNMQFFEDIWAGERASLVRETVAHCSHRCWMTGTAVPAMRHHLPSVAWWVLRNKVRLAAGRPVDLRG